MPEAKLCKTRQKGYIKSKQMFRTIYLIETLKKIIGGEIFF